MLNKVSNPIKCLAAGVLVAAILLSVLPRMANASAPSQQVQGGFNCTYVVQRGDTLYRIAVRHGVSIYALASVNHIQNVNFLYVGMNLRVPCINPGPFPPTPTPYNPGPFPPTRTPQPPGNNCGVHVVQRGEWLASIAARYGTTWQAIAAANHLANASFIYPGMRLIIPCGNTPVRVISLQQPFPNQGICSPVRVSGSASVSPFEATLTGRVYNATGALIGSAPVMVNAEMGKPGTFNTQFAFDTSKLGAFGRVEVAELSAKDGSVVVSASVPVRFNCF